MSIYTIGYEGKTFSSFLANLKASQIDILLDVRFTPWSHKADFSRKRLEAALLANGIHYVHAPQLGSAPALRKQLRETDDWNSFASSYREHLLGLNGQIEAAFLPFQGQRVCLLCMEKDSKRCHRSLLAECLEQVGLATSAVNL